MTMNANTVLSSIAGRALRLAGARRFKGKGRLVHHWLQRLDMEFEGQRTLPGGGQILCAFDVPYEAMVWARQEEEAELRALQALLSPGDHFVDCGANVGLWSLVAAGRVGSRGRVTAFEPNPTAYRRLTKNLSASGEVGRRVNAFNVAVAAAAGQVAFETGSHHNLGRILAKPGDGSIVVRAVSLDEQLGAAPVRALKLDIEGGEAAALRGASRLLTVQRPWLWAEFNVAHAATARIGDWDVFGLMEGHGYRCRRIAAGPRDVTDAPIAATETFTGYVNVLFEPPDTRRA
jgi:FkbM family methyltransferase